MIELSRDSAQSYVRPDLEALQQRATTQRQRHRQTAQLMAETRRLLLTLPTQLLSLHKLPPRVLLHTLVILLLPLALVLSQVPLYPATAPTTPGATAGDRPLNLGPISLDDHDQALPQVGDPPLADDEALPMPISLISRSEALAPLVVPATIAGDTVKLRNGPGLEYDDTSRLSGGTAIQVIGRYQDWLQIRQTDSPATSWVSSELVDLPPAAVYTLFEVQAEDIPPPPPPRIGMVRESGLNLRDGPGTNYVTMHKLNAGQELALVEQYYDWIHVATDSFDGWVHREFLDIQPGVLDRVYVTETIPDPHPPLIAMVNENAVNLRKGPGSGYDRLGAVNSGTQVDLLARHKDWYQVQLSDGTKAWIFSDLLNIAPMAARRVPVTNDIPALPARALRNGGSGGGAVGIPASGDVAGYALQFVGYRYVFGGASPSSGFDCSGLVSYVYRQFGVSLPRTAAAQFSSGHGAMVGDMNNLAPGDLMFFVNTGGRRGITHVAIYVGGGRMVHAMMPGLGVQVSNIWSSYWVRHYYGAVRVRR